MKFFFALLFLVSLATGFTSVYRFETPASARVVVQPAKPAVDQTLGPLNRFCKLAYILDRDDRMTVCAYRQMSDQELVKVWRQFYRSLAFYKEFLDQNQFKVRADYHLGSQPKFWLIPANAMDSAEYFAPAGEGRQTVARYARGKGWLIFSDRALDDSGPSSTDLSHEIAHYVNEDLGIIGDIDERLAQAFEVFYAKRIVQTSKNQTPLADIVMERGK